MRPKNASPQTITGIIACAMMSLGLAACSSSNDLWGDDMPHPVVATPDPVAVRLADAAQKTSSAMASLAAVEQARTPSPPPPVTPASNDDMQKPISVSWTGPAAPLAQRLATRVGYHFRQIGTPPTIAPTVDVTTVEQPVIEVLRDVGLQLGAKANLVVDSQHHVVELEYAPVGQ